MTVSSIVSSNATTEFRQARDFLLRHRDDYTRARDEFVWPRPPHFNWAFDWFDQIAEGNTRTALWIVEEDGAETRISYAAMSARSHQVAHWLRDQGVRPGDRVLLMLGNQSELWETVLAVMKLRAVIIPSTPLLGPKDLNDRVRRGEVRHVIARAADTVKFDEVEGDYQRIVVGGARPGWKSYADSHAAPRDFTPEGPTRAEDTLLLYFTSGTTASPKLVEHSHVSYPIGHLSTMYGLGLQPGDVHLNISSPGWAKHAWSSLFAPWNAEATIFVYNYQRFDPAALMRQMDRAQVTTFCAPPTVWRMLIQADLSRLEKAPREVVAAGEPLNPEVIETVREAWGVAVRDGFGQTETTLQVGNTPGQPLKPGSMGRPAPGYTVELVDPVSGKAGVEEGEICLDLSRHPLGLMTGYHGDPERTAECMRDGYYHTGDIAARDSEGYFTYVGRTDEVFKSSDYKISPFELESVLLEHEAVAEAAIVPAPDSVKLTVPKAYVVLADGWEPGEETARALFAHCRQHLAPYKRVRRLEFAPLPKTVSGKIRRVVLREATASGSAAEYDEADFR